MLVFVLSAIGSGVAFTYTSVYMIPIICIVAMSLIIFINEKAQRIRERDE